MEAPDGACSGVLPSICITFLLPKAFAPALSPATKHWLLRCQKARAASLFSAVDVTPQTAIHYHSNEPATMEEKKRTLISLQRPSPSTP